MYLTIIFYLKILYIGNLISFFIQNINYFKFNVKLFIYVKYNFIDDILLINLSSLNYSIFFI